MFGYVDEETFLPTEQEETDRATKHDRDEEPHVVRHDDEHQEIGEC